MRFIFLPAALAAGLLALLAGAAWAQGTPVDVVIADACANNGAWLKWAAGLFGASTAASYLANFRSKLPPWLVTALDLAAGNFVKKGPPAATVLACLAALGLAACQGAAGDVATAVAKSDAAIAAPQTQADIALACDAVKVADAGFGVAVIAGKVSADDQTIEKKVIAALFNPERGVCVVPPTDLVAALKQIAEAAAQIGGLTPKVAP